MNNNSRVNVTILDKEYQVACQPEERGALMSAARELDARMRKIRNSGTVIGADRIAVMVGLNLCYELQQAQSSGSEGAVSGEALSHLVARLDEALKI